jgi:hypothetical protein
VCNYAILSGPGSVYFQPAQDDGAAIPEGGLQPEDPELQAAAAGALVKKKAAGGGLAGFLSAQSSYLQNATFSVQNTLANIRNQFSGRRIVFPQGVAAEAAQIRNQASFAPAPTGRPIHEMLDEYVNRQPASANFDEEELQRVTEELRLQTGEELARRAKDELAKLGVNTDRRENQYLLHGRNAFRGFRSYGSFGIRRAAGELI